MKDKTRNTKNKNIQKHSIFNDVLGPIMCGPSSSHSAGCTRIGNMTRSLYGKEIQKAIVIYDSQGSYPSTCLGQGSNFGFTGGLLGLPTEDSRVKDSQKLAKEMGVSITFQEKILSGSHPNEARIEIYDFEPDSLESSDSDPDVLDPGTSVSANSTLALSLLTFSTGGGTFRIVEMDGFPVEIDGSKNQVYFYFKSNHRDNPRDLDNILDEIKKIAPDARCTCVSGKDSTFLICIEDISESEKNALEKLQFPGLYKIRTANVVLPVGARAKIHSESQAAFSSCADALDYISRTGKSTWQAAIDYECAVGEIAPEQVMELAKSTKQVMKNAMIAPDKETTKKYGFLDYQSKNMQEKELALKTGKENPTKQSREKIVDTGFLNSAMFGALAVMENSCAHNLVAAAPTAGSSGVIPATIISIGESMGLSEDVILQGLLVAGLAGSFIANQASFGAEVAACQAENGSASAMAAAGLTHMLGGSASQCFQAASLALQNMLGLICDPVGGLTEIPCISRNISALSNAVMSANMTILGFNSVIPFDETIEAMYHTGQMMPAELRCTCKGGLCTTRTGKELSKTSKI